MKGTLKSEGNSRRLIAAFCFHLGVDGGIWNVYSSMQVMEVLVRLTRSCPGEMEMHQKRRRRWILTRGGMWPRCIYRQNGKSELVIRS